MNNRVITDGLVYCGFYSLNRIDLMFFCRYHLLLMHNITFNNFLPTNLVSTAPEYRSMTILKTVKDSAHSKKTEQSLRDYTYTVTNDYLVLASNQIIALPRMEKPAVITGTFKLLIYGRGK
jgi:hypothetical protein